MRIHLISLFPGFFEGPLQSGLLGKAIRAGLASVQHLNPRDFSEDKHHRVDAAPCGGGGGMLMQPGPLVAALQSIPDPGPILLMSPQGRAIRQSDLERWSKGASLTLISGRYEGFDERVRSHVTDEISLGDFVLTGGEYAALALVDGVLRLRPGTLGNPESSQSDSFSTGLLEHPQYTLPLSFEGERVPELLFSGHHAKVAAFRHAEALKKTRKRRPDLLKSRALQPDEAAVLWESKTVSSAVAWRPKGPPRPGEIADWTRLAAAYQLESMFIWGPESESWEAALAESSPIEVPVRPLSKRRRRGAHPSLRIDPQAILRFETPSESLRSQAGTPFQRIACAPWLAFDADVFPLEPHRGAGDQPFLLMLGGLPEGLDARWLAPIRGGVATNRIPALALAAVALDRLRGEG